ncbi:transmembrane protein 25 isoform X2 [Anas acuta]|uniref:transmembrane protein 25 isoform X2 n=1 Tax=Anas acuta TaxID=28680 RepID=UPI0035C8A6C8
MGSLRGCPGAALTPLLLLGFPVLCLAGLREPGPTIDGRPLASCTLREEERRAFTCRAPRAAPGSVLTWYLDGRRQEANCSAAGTASSTLTITARRADRELNCSMTHPASGATANASVLLDVQYKPEILRADARYEEVDDAGLLLLLFVLVQANPPASITWVDQDGRVVANASEFLLLDTKHYPGLANHSLHVHLGSAATNLSVSAANSLGVTTASLLPPGSLLSRHPRHSRTEHTQTPSTCLPRENRSLPPNLHLGELTQEERADPGDVEAKGGQRTLQTPLVLSEGAQTGLVPFPMAWRIYKVPSMSSDEIWL